MTTRLHPLTVRQLGEIADGTALHGYVFHGPVGAGKAGAALRLAQRLNCQAGGEDGCAVCHQIEAGNYPNVIIVRPQDKPSIGIDQIRDLTQVLSYQPYVKSGRRVVIIEEAQTMTREAQNALLKLLEEPPAATLMILHTPSRQALLPTVISRLGSVYFPALGEGTPRPEEAVASAGKLLKGSLFIRLIEAGRIAGAKEDVREIADALHAATADKLRDGAIEAAEAARIMQAAEQVKHHLAANVTPRSALEHFVLEAA